MNQESRKAGKGLRNSEITDRIIAAAIHVHRELGPGFLEGIYEEALAVEFALSGIQFVRQKPVTLFYKDHQIGEHRLDFLVENHIVVELKAIKALEDIHFSRIKLQRKDPKMGPTTLVVKRVGREYRPDHATDVSF